MVIGPFDHPYPVEGFETLDTPSGGFTTSGVRLTTEVSAGVLHQPMHLKQTPPSEAKNRYLTDKRPTVTDKTLYNYDTSLTILCEWLDN